MYEKVVVTKGIFPLPTFTTQQKEKERNASSLKKKEKNFVKKKSDLFPADSILTTSDPNVEQRQDLPRDTQVWIPVPEQLLKKRKYGCK